MRCRYCSQALSDLRRRLADFCEASACRQADALARFEVQRRTEAQARVEGLAASLQARQTPRTQAVAASLRAAPVLWLQHHGNDLVQVPLDAREVHVRHLSALAADPQAHPRNAHVLHYPDDPDAAPATTVDRQVCGLCRGRCCRHGRVHHGFIDVGVLQRWRDQQGGSLADAARHYVQRLPLVHVAGSCLYHGPKGCVLPREERAPVCNGFACDSLQAARARLEARDDAGAVLMVADRGHTHAAGWLHRDRRGTPRLRRFSRDT